MNMSAREQIMQYWWLIALSISTSVIAQTVIKMGISQPDNEIGASGLLSLVVTIFQSPMILVGLGLYGIGALSWIAVLGRLDLSYAYPFLALNFVLITLVSRLVLGETVPTLRWLGLGFICVGIVIVAQSVQ